MRGRTTRISQHSCLIGIAWSITGILLFNHHAIFSKDILLPDLDVTDWSTNVAEDVFPWPCLNGCSGHGVCSSTNRCECFDGFTDNDCSKRICPSGTAWVLQGVQETSVHTTPVACSNMGNCNTRTGKCQCYMGFTGEACERTTCPGEGNCSGHGRCMSMEQAAKEYDGMSLLSPATYSLWDATKIYGCVCDNGFSGNDCNTRSCPRGDDPFTTGQLNEIQILSCLCDACSGYFTLQFQSFETTASIPFSATAADLAVALNGLPSIAGVQATTLGGAASSVCTSNGASTAITFTANPGNLPPLAVYSTLSSGAGAITTPSISVQTGGAAALYGNTNFLSVEGTRENVECSGRGTCDRSTGLCNCFAGFASSDGANGAGSRGDCGFMTSPPTTCVRGRTLPCSGNGICDANFQCQCNPPYTGPDCSEWSCQKGRAWFDEATATDTAHADGAECSNRAALTLSRVTNNPLPLQGLATGGAEDAHAFEDLKVLRASDPDLYALTLSNLLSQVRKVSCPSQQQASCSGHGVCRPQSVLTAASSQDGVSLGYTYGSSTGVNKATWDSNMIHGCLCDKVNVGNGEFASYRGPDCSQFPCPSGSDPWAAGTNTIQQVTCAATSGTFRISFRGDQTTSISFDANAATLEDALESLQSLDNVRVTSSTLTLCSSVGSVTSITFTDNFGALPILVPDITGLAHTTPASLSLVVSLQVTGTKVAVECSGRGVCDRNSGMCKCAKGYASSDGNGSLGVRNDCGSIFPYQSTT